MLLKTSSPSVHWINYAITDDGVYFRFRSDTNVFYRIKAQEETWENSDMLQPITLSSTGITYDENYVDSSGTTISVYKMGRLVIITGSMRFAGEPFSNNVLIRNLPVSCWQTRFGLTSYVTNASQVFGVLGGDSINMSGSPVSSREYRFCFATFSNS